MGMEFGDGHNPKIILIFVCGMLKIRDGVHSSKKEL
jgi:hypothetical protein